MNAATPFDTARQALMDDLPREDSGRGWCHRYTALVDDFLIAAAESAAGSSASSGLAVLAVGGYGRREMAPYSDVDLLVIPASDADLSLDESVRKLHRALLSAFEQAKGPAFSYAFFLQNDATALDFKTVTALLDARHLFGHREASERFVATAIASLPPGEFLVEKLRERKAALAKWNETPLAVEPNLKEGAGGLRCFHAENWIRRTIEQPLMAEHFWLDQVLRMRNLLHAVSGRNNDLFTRARQAEIAEWISADPKELFRETAFALEALQSNWEDAVRLIGTSSFRLTPHVRAVAGNAQAEGQPTLSEAAAGIALAAELGLNVTREWKAEPIGNGPQALYAVASGEATLRGLDQAGVLRGLLPELENCRTLMPEDAVHAFTVYEHSLRTVRNLEAFAPDSFYGRLREGLSDVSPLFLAALLHDVGKAVVGRPHSETGAEIVRQVAQRWELAPRTARLAEWLVREHLTLARFIGMRDVADPAAIEEFAAIVQDRERLDMLAILTCADVSAVAPHAWTPAQDAFLRELHERTAARLEAEVQALPDAETMRRRVVRSLRDHPIDPEELERFLNSLPAQYAVHTPPEVVPVHMDLVTRARQGEPSAVWDHDRDKHLSELTVCALDRPGLLNQILGVLYAFDLSVFALRANTTAGLRPVALDTVVASFGHQVAPPATCALIARALNQVILGEDDLNALMAKHGKDPNRRQENCKFDFIEGRPGILEIQAPRGRGMAYRISNLIWRQGWDIVAARFGQWAGQGAAAFYLTGPEGRPLTKAEVESAIAG